MNRVYRGCPSTIRITDSRRSISVAATGATSTVVWNPGPGAEVTGLAADEWRSMICVEVGNVIDHPVQVRAGGSHVLGMEISVAARQPPQNSR